jgi:4-hydroxy-tetrahydrodipicolinate synthase
MLKLDDGALRGSIPPLVTPFRDGAIDEATYARLIERQCAAGSDGILVNGTTAEPAALSVAERNRLVDVALEAAAGRLAVVVATGSQSLAETEALTMHAARRPGVAALLIVTPYYSRPPQRGLVEYYRRLNKLHDKPWLIYHIPARAAVDVNLETVRAIALACPTFVGLKHASTDLGLVSALLAELGEELRIFVGLEELSMPMLAVGACGLMNAVGNLCPAPLAELCRAVAAGDLAVARARHRALLALNQAVFFDPNPIPMKYMMRRLGLLPSDELRLPLLPATPDLAARLDAVLTSSGLL